MKWLVGFLIGLSITTHAQTKTEIIHKIEQAAIIGGIDPDLAVAIATVESGLNPESVGDLNEQGVFQLRPEFHSIIPGNTNYNILVGVSYLVLLKNKFQGKYKDAWFVTFNRGPNAVITYPKQTKYYQNVMVELNKIRFNKLILRGVK